MLVLSSLSYILPAALLLLNFLPQKADSRSNELNLTFDLWDAVVSRHILPGTLENISLNTVDYGGISKDPNFTAYIKAIATVKTDNFDKNTTYAFFMNVYNALAIKMIIDHPCKSGSCNPLKSIRDVGTLFHSVWKMPAGMVAGKQWSLDEVEGYLRDPKPFKEDSRLHACIVCASISCPNVRREAFRPEHVDKQMDDQVKDFLMNDKKGFLLDRSSNKVHLSPIFLWFVLDFEPYGGITKFISPYLPPSDSQFLAQHKPSLSYFTYNWNVNGKPPCDC